MDIKTLIAEANGNVIFRWDEPEGQAEYDKIPRDLSSALGLMAKFTYPKGLYTHQSRSIEALLQGNHTAICTSTASGKSLCFSYPVINTLLQNPQSRALFVFPIKALANDQIRRLKGLLKQLRLDPELVKRFDGDVLGEERKEAIAKGQILVCTPDVLHTTLLRENGKPEYKRFFANLEQVVLDECHVYSGAFGSNMAYVLRRLRQVCQYVGSSPRYILSSATVGEPHQHLSRLTGLEDLLVIGPEEDGSPAYGKEYFFVEPEGKAETFVLKIIKGLIREGKRFLLFCHARQEVERLYAEILQKDRELAGLIRPYRAGYEAVDRQGIEKSLREGRLQGVISTSALELGIDLPDLDICLMLGLPSTKNSFVQRAGRVGRLAPGTVLVIKMETAFDAYYFNHPEEFLHKPLEQLPLHLQNQQLMLAHFACARAESADFERPQLAPDIFGWEFLQLANRIREYDFPDEILYLQNPHFEVQIRCISDPSYNIVVGWDPSAPPLGTINYSQLLREAYPEAAYLHLGRRYKVRKLSYSKKTVFVDTRCPVVFTKPKAEIFIRERHRAAQGVAKSWGSKVRISQNSLGIVEKLSGCVESSGRTKRDVDYAQPLMRHFVTEGVSIYLQGFAALSHVAVVGLATALERAYPMCYPCAKEDIASYAWTKQGEEGHIYLYDTSAGGLALTWPAVDHFERLLDLTRELVANCPNCRQSPDQKGCINCVDDNRWYTYNFHSDRQGVLILLDAIRAELRDAVPVISAARQQQKARKEEEIPANYFGRTMISIGSLVFTGKCQEGFILASKPFNSVVEDRLYDISINGKVHQFLGGSLTLLQGNIEKWCSNCGEEAIDLAIEKCPVCEAVL